MLGRFVHILLSGAAGAAYHFSLGTRSGSFLSCRNRLDVCCASEPVFLADAEVPVVLDRHADERGDRIGKFLGQFGGG
jgi:hypothetical protein